MTRLLDVLENYLEWRGLRFLRLDGGTATEERGQLVEEFNAQGARHACVLCDDVCIPSL